MIISIHQPHYLPWLGYFDKVARSDIFVFLDTVQFQKNGFQNRNKIKTSHDWMWLTVPVITTGHTEKSISDLKIDNKQKWQKKHWKSIKFNYKKAPFFEEHRKELKKFYDKDWVFFSDLCWDMLKFWNEKLGIKTKIIKASSFSPQGHKSRLILNICKQLEADTYLAGSSSRDYLDLKQFKDNNISVKFQNYTYPQYPQLYGEFIPNLSIVDLIMNVENPLSIILKGGQYDKGSIFEQ